MKAIYKKNKNNDIYYKILNDRKIIVFDFVYPEIAVFSNFSKDIEEELIESSWYEFNTVFNKVHRKINDLLLDIEYNEGGKLTSEVANLVRNYDYNYLYIEDSGQMRKAEEKNIIIKDKLRKLGVKSFNGIKI